METDTDAALVARARAGDRDAFGQLVQRYMRRAYAQALGLVGSREDAMDLGRDILAVLRNIVGGEIHDYTKLMAEAREQALDRMVATAAGRGANAVINVRFSTSYIMSNASEILAFGDAVVLERDGDGEAVDQH